MEIDTDAVLLARVRDEGDIEAFGHLYERHAGATRRFARSLCGNDADADDLTADVFTGLLTSLRRGNGPTELALPYLFASIKHQHWRAAGRSARETALASTVRERVWCDGDDLVEAEVVRTALSTLPDGVQALLWRTEVDDECLDDAAGRDGMSAHNLAVHRHRARRALGTAYLAQHAEPDGGLLGLDPECQANLPHLASLVRNKLGVRRRRRVEQHIDTCEQCALTKQRLELINTRLRAHPKLPWSIWSDLWSAGFTSAIKAQVSSVLGTSAVVTVAGSSALAMAVLLPTPLSIDPDGDAVASESVSTTGSSAREHHPPSQQAPAEDATTSDDEASDDEASGPADAAGESSWFLLPAAPTADPATTAAHAAPSDTSESIVTASTSADMPSGVAHGARLIRDVTTAPQAAADAVPSPALIGPAAIGLIADAAESNDDRPRTGAKAQSSGTERVTPGGQATGGSQNNSDGGDHANGGVNDQGTANTNREGNANSLGNATGNTQGNTNADAQGDANDHGTGKGLSNWNGQADATADMNDHGNRNAKGQAASAADNGNAKRQPDATADMKDHGNGNQNANGQADATAKVKDHGNGNGNAKGQADATAEVKDHGKGNANGQADGDGTADADRTV